MSILLIAKENEKIYYIEQIKNTGSYSMTTDRIRAHNFKTTEKANNVLNSLPKLLKKYNWVVQLDSSIEKTNSVNLNNYNINLPTNEKIRNSIVDVNNIIMNYNNTTEDIINIIVSFITIFKEKQQEYDALRERLFLLEKELVDLNHLIEFNNLSASQGYYTYKIQQEKLQQRRYIKNLKFTYEQLLSLLDENKMINSILSIKGLENQKYAPRTELYCDLLYSMKGVERCDE